MSLRHITTLLFPVLLTAAIVVAAESTQASEAESMTAPVGVAKIDVTPDYPIRLTGYAGRQSESEGVAQRLWAKALAIGPDQGDGPAVLLTVDNCGVPDNVTRQVAARLKTQAGVRQERLVICSSHTHTGPWLKGFLPWHYVDPLPKEQQDHIGQYTGELTGKLERVALDALARREPGRLAWAEGKVTFAANRRALEDGKWKGFGVNPDGPVDHSLPMLRVTDAQGNLAAVVVNYACHCTTLTGRHNQLHGDWAGCAGEFLEAELPDVIAMVCVGCGGDANPEPRGELEMATQHGRAVADEVERLLNGKLRPVQPSVIARQCVVKLPFDELPTRQELEARVAAGREAGSSSTAVRRARHAQHFLDQLQEGQALPAALDYSVTTWAFGDDLAMVFMPGEVVVDYALRFKREFDGARLWVTAYANDVPCYIPSVRILEEGGYEADHSMISYGQPTRFAPAVEDRIIEAVRPMLPKDFHTSAE